MLERLELRKRAQHLAVLILRVRDLGERKEELSAIVAETNATLISESPGGDGRNDAPQKNAC